MEYAISTSGLTKRYAQRTVVDNIALQVRPGEIYGFLGPNGAGKTTTIHMLLGIVRPTSGVVRVLGQEMSQSALTLKQRIGVVSEHQSLYGDMTAEEYLRFFADLFSVPNAGKRIGELLEAVDLLQRRRSRIKEFSHGMQQKLSLVRALLHSPDLLIMDEPASGLDPYGISQVRGLINDLKRAGKTIFLSSHILSEIEQTADRVAILARGQIVAEGAVADIQRELEPGSRYAIEYEGDEAAIRQALSALPTADSVAGDPGKLHLQLNSSEDLRAEISRLVTAAGGTVLGITRIQMSLEEAFMTVTNEKMGNLQSAGVLDSEAGKRVDGKTGWTSGNG